MNVPSTIRKRVSEENCHEALRQYRNEDEVRAVTTVLRAGIDKP